MKKNKKITTIEDLAEAMQKGFSETRQELTSIFDNKIDAKFKEQDRKIDAKFEKQEDKFDAKIDNLVIIIQKGFEEMATKKDINDSKSGIMTLRYDFEELKLKISKLEIVPIELNFKIQDFEKRIKKIEAEIRLK